MSEHAPGPWRVVGRHPNGEVVIKSSRMLIGTAVESDKEYKAWDNAHLMAAAPELLEVCEYWLADGRFLAPHTNEYRVALRMLKAAIEKARGA